MVCVAVFDLCNSYGAASGVAPRAFLSVYKIFWSTTNKKLKTTAVDADAVAAVDRAVKDGVDVLSCSWGGSKVRDYISSLDYIFLNAVKVRPADQGKPPVMQ